MGIYYLVLSIVKIYLIVVIKDFVIKCRVIEILVIIYFIELFPVGG